MSDKAAITMDALMQDPEFIKVTSHLNQDLIERRNYRPPQCDVFNDAFIRVAEDDRYEFEIDSEARKKLPEIIDNKVQRLVPAAKPEETFKTQYTRARKIGIVFSGGPAPGGHNVIAGLYDAAKKVNPQNRIFGFLLGPDGIIDNEYVELDDDRIDAFRNLGGFSMIKTGRTKIDTTAKMALSRETCRKIGLDALVVVGGDDSNTNAAFLAQELKADGVQVLGVPKTIDGDIQVRDKNHKVLCAMSFGYHSAARAFANEISNLCTDSSSDVKYWHICKVMGRVASHLALEVALQTHANMTLIGEDLADFVDAKRLAKARSEGQAGIDYTAYGMTLRHLSRLICEAIVKRAAVGKNYGVVVIPEGVLEFINEIQVIIIKLNTIIAEYNETHDIDFHTEFIRLEDKREYLRRLASLSREASDISIWNTRDDDFFNDIPDFFQEGLLTERDSHGNFQFSLVPTDKVIMGLVKDYLNILRERGEYKIGIQRAYFDKTMRKADMDPDHYGSVLFDNYSEGEYLLVKKNIFSLKTLKQALVRENGLDAEAPIPPPIEKIYKMSVPKFKTQTHFYGYDGRGSDPTRFDCIYTYNLGMTVFNLIANGATGQMAAIKNLERSFAEWEPIGIPIAPLMHLEERKGRLTLVLEKSVVDTHSIAFQTVKALREKWLGAEPGEDDYRRPGPIRFTGKSEEDRPITLVLNALADKITS